MSQNLYAASPTKSTFALAPSNHCAAKMSAELIAEGYALVAQTSKARQDFIALRELCLEQIATRKALIAVMDAHISEHHKRLPGWKPNEGTF